MLRFGNLNFVANANINLELGDPMARRIIDVNAIADDTFLNTEKLVITHRINSYLRSNPPLEDINATHYVLVNIFSQLMMEALE